MTREPDAHGIYHTDARVMTKPSEPKPTEPEAILYRNVSAEVRAQPRSDAARHCRWRFVADGARTAQKTRAHHA
jgi:hypothetical protein